MPISLFPDDPKFTANNWIPLDRDSKVWDAFITAQIKKLIPKAQVDITIKWNSKDDKKGYGVGSLIVITKDNKNKFIIPVIVKDFKLAPLDVIITEHRAMRVTAKNIEDILFSGAMSSGTSKRKGYDADDTGYMPLDTEYQTSEVIVQKSSSANLMELWMSQDRSAFEEAEMSNYGSLCDHISDTINKTAAKRVKDAMSRPDILHKFANEKSIFVEFINKIDTDNLQVKETDIDDNGTKIEVVKKIGPAAYVMMSSSIENFLPSIDITNGSRVRFELKKQIGNDDVVDSMMAAIEATGERAAIVPWAKDDDATLVYDDKKSDFDYGIYEAYDEKGNKDRGVLYNKQYDLRAKQSTAKLFITKIGGGLQDSGFKGMECKACRPTLYNDEYVDCYDRPSAGDYGVWVNGKAVIGPIFIQSVSSDMFDNYTILANDGKSDLFEVKLSDNIDGIKTTEQYTVKNEKENLNKVTISTKFKWMPIKVQKKYSNKHALKKEAHVSFDNDRYRITGMNLEQKWASQLDEATLKFVLSSHGMSMGKIAYAIALSQRTGDATITNIPGFPYIQKVASINTEANFQYIGFDPADFELTKIAGMFEKLDTVDQVLGLNFINKSNVSRFLSAIPMFIESREELTRLLIVSRMGVTEVPEEAILQALDALDTIIEGLQRLKLKND